ncbi:MAG: hypothetical protein Kow00124_23540 [Anaerolineae bacterium]
MSKTLKIVGLIAGAVLVAGLAFFGVTQAFAQDDTPETPTVPGPGGFGPGGMHGGAGGWMAEYRDLMLGPVAEALGLTLDELNAEIAVGKPMWQIAEEQGVDSAALAEAMQAGREAAIAQAVEDGVITQAQADWMLEHSGGFGPGGCPGGFGGGMRGPGGGLRGWQAPTTAPNTNTGI